MAEQQHCEDKLAADPQGARRFVSQFGELVRDGHVRPEPRTTLALVLLAAVAVALVVHDLFLA